ncbi:hypothetical protein PIB30_076913 [Stylosanthes scabra]|uniref:Uncharacterized protein n=1 Tax=Stylosanthes scabra TaxID=79078 RepID=A0ABU6SQJ8_9FABA|nr:hypothetical protein [Stylosanthes scabra]
MGRTKSTAKRASQRETTMEQPPQDHPMARFFTNLVDFNNYIIKFAPRKETTPRYLSMSLLDSQNFNNIRRILSRQRLDIFVTLRGRYYLDLVAIANSTMTIDSNEENPSLFTIHFSLENNKYELHIGAFCHLTHLNWSGTLFKSGDNPPSDWNFNKIEACHYFNLDPNSGNKIPIKPMNDEYRFIHYFLVWIILPRTHNNGVVMDDELVILWAMVHDLDINWSYFIVQHMKKIQEGSTTLGLPYVILWTKIFKHLNIDLSNAIEKGLKETNCINIATLHKMGRGGIANQPQMQEEYIQDQAQEVQGQEQPYEHIGSSNIQQPSMLDLMQELQRINSNITRSKEENQRNFTRMDRRFARLNRQVESVYAYLGIPQPPQEDEDEDED